jgi:hypothetical protein
MMAALNGRTDVIYHGVWRENGRSVINIEDEEGVQLGVVRHLPKHSPTGMNWGFAGSGSADTARSLLIAVLGDESVCAVCRGTGRVVYVRSADGLLAEPYDPVRHPWTREGWKCECDDGYRLLPYPAFTRQFVASWGKEWVMSRAAILGWLKQNQADPEQDEASRGFD